MPPFLPWFAPEPCDPLPKNILARCFSLTIETQSFMSAQSKLVALGALIFFLLVSYGSCTRIVNFNASHITTDPYWVAARATWYGAPTGAGPYDNGMYMNVGAWCQIVYGVHCCWTICKLLCMQVALVGSRM